MEFILKRNYLHSCLIIFKIVKLYTILWMLTVMFLSKYYPTENQISNCFTKFSKYSITHTKFRAFIVFFIQKHI